MKESHRIVIAEDHTILREGLEALLSSHADFEVVGQAEDGLEAVRKVEELNPDLILLDLAMPKMHGLEVIREIRSRCPETRILVLTVHKNEEYIFATLGAGASGYLLKDATRTELEMAVRTVLSGKRFLSPGISDLVIDGYIEGKKTLKTETAWDTLTPREREILKLVAEGYKNREIADVLCISIKTAEKHRSNLMKKLDLHSISAVTSFAIEKGLIQK